MTSKKPLQKNKAAPMFDERTFRLMFEGHSAVMLLVEPHTGNILDANQAAVDFYGYSESKLCSMSINEINTLPPQQVAAERQKAISAERNYFVFSHRLSSGEERVVEVHSSPIALHEKQLLFSIIHDITERKQAEDLLERTHKNYEAFFNSIDDFLFVLDEQGNIIHTNKTVTDRLGYSTAELLGNSVLMVHPPERREEAGRIVGEMLAGTAEFCPVPIMAKSGLQIPVETRVTPGFWDDKPAIFGVTKDISQIKLSEEKFSKAFQSNSALMALSRFEDGAYIDVNAVFLKTLGFTRDDVIGKTSTGLHLFADAEQRNQLIEKIKQDGTVKDIELTVQTKDGSLRDGLFSADTIYIGEDLCLLTVMVDITERKRIVEALAEESARRQALFEQSPDGILIIDPQTARFLEFNTAAHQQLGYSREEFAELSILDVEVSETADQTRARIDHVIKNGRADFETLQRIKQGDVRTVHVKAQIVNVREHPVYYCIWRDVTERKQMEEALRQSDAMFQSLFEFAPDAIVAMNREGIIMRVNAQTEAMFGYRREELRGQSVEILIPERFSLRHVGHRAGYADNPYARAMGTGLKFYGRRKDRSEFPVEVSLGTLETSSETLILSTIRDVTERKQVEAELRRSKETLDIAHHALERSFEREQQLARTDALTGVHNRRFLFELAEREFEAAMRYRPPLSILMFDIDYFKNINDTFGHSMGDKVLQQITQVVRAEIRSADVIGRYGGDEFVVLLPHTSTQESLPLAERLHACIAAIQLETDKGQLSVTVSIGISQTIHQAVQPDTVEDLFLRADQALYAAKHGGRNRTVIFEK
jgi:diguanylate cyclase (GGDEF)-like protein/PAS domain S-box-containing protein